MNLYRDNANPTTVRPDRPASSLPLPSVVPQPDVTPWAFRTREDFAELMNRWGLTGVGVEVGCYRGGFATCILKSWPGVLHCVDPWEYQPGFRDMLNTPDQPRNEAIARNELSGWVAEGRCAIHKGFSVDVAQSWAHGPLDFVYVDALHNFQSCLDDLTAWAPLIRSGGALCGHDYIQHPTGVHTVTEFEVVEAVAEWCRRNGYAESDILTTTNEGYPSFCIKMR